MDNTIRVERATVDGVEYHVRYVRDDDGDPPWDREDGHGPVSKWLRRDKAPGERVLHEDRGSKRFYDFAEATRIAKRDGWGVSDPKPGETKAAQRARAVQADFERLRAWCRDEWHYMGVIVTPFCPHCGERMDSKAASLWGIESDSGDAYLAEVIADLVDQVEASSKAA